MQSDPPNGLAIHSFQGTSVGRKNRLKAIFENKPPGRPRDIQHRCRTISADTGGMLKELAEK